MELDKRNLKPFPAAFDSGVFRREPWYKEAWNGLTRDFREMNPSICSRKRRKRKQRYSAEELRH